MVLSFPDGLSTPHEMRPLQLRRGLCKTKRCHSGNKCQKELVSIEGKDRHTIANRHSDGAVRARGVADTCV